MKERVLNLLSLCIQAKEKGHDVFFFYLPHVDVVDITIFLGGWKENIEPDKRFYIHLVCEQKAEEAANYLKGLM